MSAPVSTATDFTHVANVPASYVHHDTWVEPGERFEHPAALLKWYNVGRPGVPFVAGAEADARAFIAGEIDAGRFDPGYGAGWVLLHDCAAVTFLLVGVWRDNNECWHAIYGRDPKIPGAEFTVVDEPGFPRPMMCVWEMPPVWHERNAWKQFLYSERDEAAKAAFYADQFSGIS